MTDFFEHLTDKELDALLMGAEETVFESVRKLHLRDCGACRARLAEMRAMTEIFREGVKLWAPTTGEAKANTGVLRLRASYSVQDDSRKSWTGWMAVPAMGLAAVLAVGVMVPRWMHERQDRASRRSAQAIAAQAQASQAADAVLMQQVQQQLDESVPESMAPLTALIQTENPHKTTGQAKEN